MPSHEVTFFPFYCVVDLRSSLAAVSAQKMDDGSNYRQEIKRNEPINDTFSELAPFLQHF